MIYDKKNPLLEMNLGLLNKGKLVYIYIYICRCFIFPCIFCHPGMIYHLILYAMKGGES